MLYRTRISIVYLLALIAFTLDPSGVPTLILLTLSAVAFLCTLPWVIQNPEGKPRGMRTFAVATLGMWSLFTIPFLVDDHQNHIEQDFFYYRWGFTQGRTIGNSYAFKRENGHLESNDGGLKAEVRRISLPVTQEDFELVFSSLFNASIYNNSDIPEQHRPAYESGVKEGLWLGLKQAEFDRATLEL